MSHDLKLFLLSILLMPVITTAVMGQVLVNGDFGAVVPYCDDYGGYRNYTYQGTLGCGGGHQSQDFNNSPGFGWFLGDTHPEYQGSGITGPTTAFNPPPFDGLPFREAVFLQGADSSVSQDIAGFTPGSYLVSFYLGSRFNEGYDGNQTVEALFDGQVVATYYLSSFTPFTLENVFLSVGTPGTHTLEFRGINDGDHTAFLSAVNITSGTGGTTWDATRDFGPSNPNRAWSYGYGTTGTSFTLDPIYNPDCAQFTPGFVCWTARILVQTPLVGFNTTRNWFHENQELFPPDALLVHPGPDDGQDTIVRWTAPVAGYYNISGFFEILATDPTGIVGLVYRNGTLIYSGELLGPPAQLPDRPGGREDFNFSRFFLNAGDVLSFGVNKDGNWYEDSIGFNANITIPSTPCAVCSQQRRYP